MESWQLDQEVVEVHSPRVLHSDDGAVRTILVSLPAGEQLADHQVHEHALVLVLEGRVSVEAGSDEQQFGRHALLHFEPAERHAVSALADTRLLLVLAPWPGVGHPSRTD